MISQRNWTVLCPGGATPAVCIEGQSSRNTKGTVRFWEREMPEASWKIYWNSERERERGRERGMWSTLVETAEKETECKTRREMG